MENIYHPFEPDDEKSKYSTKVTAILYLFATLIIGGGIALVIFFTSSNTFNKSASLDPNQLSPLPSTQTANEVPATNPDNSGGGSVAGVNYDTSFGPQLSNKATATPVPTFTPTPTPTSTPSPTDSPTPTPAPTDTPSPTPTDTPVPTPTDSPTPTPTDSPSPTPTGSPSTSPTDSPTPGPT